MKTWILKDENLGSCSNDRQLAIMLADGWEITLTPPEEALEEGSVDTEVPFRVEIRRGEATGSCRRSDLEKMLADGWFIVDGGNDGETQSSGDGGGTGEEKSLQSREGEGEKEEETEIEDPLVTLLAGLDPDDVATWTNEGLVRVTEVSILYGAKISKAEIENSWPGFGRSVLREYQDGGSREPQKGG